MKIPAILLVSAALFTSPFVLATRAAVSPVSVRVEQESKTESAKEKATVHRTLKITLNSSAADSLNIRVTYAFFGHDAKSHDIKVLGHGDLTTTLQPKIEQTLTTATTSATYIEPHMDKKKKVEASGDRLTGYGVKVFQGSEVIGEAYEPESMKEEMSKVPNPPAPKPAAKKK